MSQSCSVSKILSVISNNLQRSRDPEHIRFGSILALMHKHSSLFSINMQTKREMHSFIHSKDMIGPQNLKWVTWPWSRLI